MSQCLAATLPPRAATIRPSATTQVRPDGARPFARRGEQVAARAHSAVTHTPVSAIMNSRGTPARTPITVSVRKTRPAAVQPANSRRLRRT